MKTKDRKSTFSKTKKTIKKLASTLKNRLLSPVKKKDMGAEVEPLLHPLGGRIRSIRKRR